MFVVFDSNIWISQRGLKSPQAVEGLRFIKNRDAILVVPEVVRLEVEMKLRRDLLRHRKMIGESIRYIATVFGDVEEVALPTDDEVEERVRDLVKATGVQTMEIPLTIDAAKSSLHKILHKSQPSDKDEQFADGVIWANCLALLEKSEVCLVSGDKAFYKDRDYNHGIAPNLEKEATECPNKLYLYESLEKLLQHERQDVQRVYHDATGQDNSRQN